MHCCPYHWRVPQAFALLLTEANTTHTRQAAAVAFIEILALFA